MEKDEKYYKKALKGVRDFTVKLSKIYKKDFYIVDGTYLYPGIQSKTELPGVLICEIEDQYKEYLKDLNITDTNLVYINDIKIFKDDIITPKSNIDNETRLSEIRDEILNFVNKVKLGYTTWNNFEIDKNVFFDDKEIVELDSNIDNIPSVIIGLKMIPLISEKNIDSLFYVCGEEESKMSMPIYYIIFDFHTPHFRIMMKYHYVSPVV